jgi:APA family basic amino acid/polyamine antiporter
MKVVTFEKKLSLPAALAVTVGAVIGVGIFVILGPMGAKCGGTMPLAFALAAVPAVFGTLVSVALGGTIPADGGGYFYTRSLLGKTTGVVASLLIVLGAFGALGAVAIGVADYLGAYLPGVPRWVVATGLVLMSYGVNRVGVMASSWFQIALVGQLASALLIVVVAGLVAGASPDVTATPPAGWGLGGFTGAAILAALAYVGFNIIGELGDEVQNPRRNIPIAIAGGLGLIVFFYVGVAWVVSGNLTIEQMKGSKVALVDAAMLLLPSWFAHYLTLAAVAGAVTSVNAVFLAVPRELVALAEDRLLPAWLLAFDAKRQAFSRCLLVVLAAGVGVVLTNMDVDYFGVMAVVGLMSLNAIISLGAFRLVRRFPEEVASAQFPIRRVWLYPAAALSLLFSAAFALLGIVEERSVGLLVGIAVVAALAIGIARGR